MKPGIICAASCLPSLPFQRAKASMNSSHAACSDRKMTSVSATGWTRSSCAIAPISSMGATTRRAAMTSFDSGDASSASASLPNISAG